MITYYQSTNNLLNFYHQSSFILGDFTASCRTSEKRGDPMQAVNKWKRLHYTTRQRQSGNSRYQSPLSPQNSATKNRASFDKAYNQMIAFTLDVHQLLKFQELMARSMEILRLSSGRSVIGSEICLVRRCANR